MKLNKAFCFICKDMKPTSLIYDKNSMRIIRCNQCGTMFKPKEEHEKAGLADKNETPGYYSESIRCSLGNRLFFRLNFDELIKQFPYIKNGNLMDFGCGIGNSLIEARHLGFNAVGIDSSRWAIDYAKRFEIEIFPSLKDLPKQTGKFDVINLNHILEHVIDPVGLLNKLKGYLKEKGIIRIEVPNCNRFFFWRIFPENKYIIPGPTPGHIYFYSINSLKNCLLKANLEIIDAHTEGFGNFARRKATFLNPSIFVKTLSTFFYFTNIEKILGLETFLVTIAKKNLIT